MRISSVSKSCFSSIRDLLIIRNTHDFTNATSLIHFKLAYGNSLFLNLSKSQLDRLQFILNSAATAVSKTANFLHITLVFKSLHCLNSEQRIQCKINSITNKTHQSNKSTYLNDLLNVQCNRYTRSCDTVTLQRPSVCSRLKQTNSSFAHHAPVL